MKISAARIHGSLGGLVAGAALSLATVSASAATLVVSGGEAPCPGARFTTIQAAVDAAAPGDDIAVCAGTYAEQVSIPAGKNGLTLRARQPLAAIIKAPATMTDPGDIVRINAAHDVTLEGFTVSGPLPDALFCSVYPRTGLRVDGGASAVVRGNRFTEIRSADVSFRGCQSGIPILVGHGAEATTGSAVLEANAIDSFQKSGIVVDNIGSSATIVANLVTGDGPTTLNAQNGIQVSNGADAFVGGNTVSGEVYSPSPLASALLFYRPGRVTAIGNVVRDADYGIITVDAKSPQLRNNLVSACTANGIDLDEEEAGTSGAIVVANDSQGSGGDGIYVSASSTKNTLEENRAGGDHGLDARDDSAGHGTAGTGNEWARNHCKTDNLGGRLCEP